MNTGIFGIGALIVFAVVILVVLVGRYRTASPDKALIVSGSYLGSKNVFKNANGSKIKIVQGGGTFVFPVFQQARELSLLSSKLDISTPEALTEEGVPVTVDGTVIIKIGSTVEEIATAAEQYLSKPVEERLSEAREVLEGHLRAILGRLTVEDTYQSRDKFNGMVQEVASVDLAKMGLVIVSFTVKEIKDKNGYLDALGKPRIAQVKRDADMAMAEADKETRIKRAEAEKDSQEKEIQRETETAENNKIKILKLAVFKQEQDVATAKADNAYKLETARLNKVLKEEEMEVEIIEREKQIELQEKETIRRERQYDSEIKKKADAERYAIEQKAEADKNKSVYESEARAKEIELSGHAKSESIRAIGGAEAEARAKEIELNGKSKSESIRAIGLAEAEAKTAWAEALKNYGSAAITTLLIEKYPEIIRASAEPMSNIDKITVIDGGDGNGATAVAGYASKLLAASQETLKDTTGLNLSELINSAVGNSNVGAKVGQLTDTIKDVQESEIDEVTEMAEVAEIA